ncbi:MAG TPA: DUF4468 domain-containing protein [Bacteroidaceae bacterium]|nr:DUF4468 domain-containing protein [Bacteroidaceae bacterium]
MKKTFLSLCGCFVIMAAMAQNVSDPKYGVGAVPEVNGKIVFENSFSLSDLDNDKCFNVALAWAKGRFVSPTVIKSEITEQNKEERTYSLKVEEYIVFKNRPLTLDRTRIYYDFDVSIFNNICTVKMSNIRYLYDEDRNGGIRFTAEEWINDQNSLNKKKTRFLKSTGKFRIKTIDLKELLNNQLKEAVTGK